MYVLKCLSNVRFPLTEFIMLYLLGFIYLRRSMNSLIVKFKSRKCKLYVFDIVLCERFFQRILQNGSLYVT